MNNIAHLLKDSNSFSHSEIQLASQQLFHHISLDFQQEMALEQKEKILSGLIEMLRLSLYSDDTNGMKDSVKSQLIKLLGKLKKQLEIVELLRSGDKKVVQKLASSAKQMDNKTKM